MQYDLIIYDYMAKLSSVYLSSMRLGINNQKSQTLNVQSLWDGLEQSIRGNPISNNQNLLSGVLFSVSLSALHLSRQKNN